MGETRYIDFSDAAIKRVANDESVRVLRDEFYPELRLRFRDNHRQAAWDVRHDGKWKKAGNWPRWSWSAMLAALPGVLASRASNGVSARVGTLVTVGDLLAWYLERHLNTATLSKARKAACRTMFRGWLQPRLGAVSIVALNRAQLDRLLIQPMQAELAPATVCKAYRMLLAAIHAAQRLGLLVRNPLEGVKFPEFGLGPIRPKEARLFPKDAGAVVARLAERIEADPRDCLLALLMLLHGTRVGETRQARWADFDLENGWWVIPAERTKTRARHELPLTVSAIALLRWYREVRPEKLSVFLFPSGHGRPLSEAAAGWVIRGLSGGAWSSHDLRKVARAGWAELGVDYLIAEQLLNHAMPGLAATYVQTDLSRLKREALELWHGKGNGRAQGLSVGSRFPQVSPGQ
ncbi:integrase [Pseudomonas sp. TE3786]